MKKQIWNNAREQIEEGKLYWSKEDKSFVVDNPIGNLVLIKGTCQTGIIDTSDFKEGDNLYIDNDKPGCLIALKDQSIDTIKKKIAIFQIDFAYNYKNIAKLINMKPWTFNNKWKSEEWLFDEVRAIKKMFKDHDMKF